jgi:hypothetical protein
MIVMNALAETHVAHQHEEPSGGTMADFVFEASLLGMKRVVSWTMTNAAN